MRRQGLQGLVFHNLICGPVDLETLMHWVGEGRVQRDTWIHWETANDWVAAGDIEELEATFSSMPAETEEAAEPKPEEKSSPTRN